jgi:hypothetical protein
MENELLLGLRISALGLVITFVAMSLVVLVMVALLRFLPARGATSAEASPLDQARPEPGDEKALEEMAVALAVGVCLLELEDSSSHRDPSLGKLLEE